MDYLSPVRVLQERQEEIPPARSDCPSAGKQRLPLLDESGQSLAVWVAAIFVMVLMLALVVDGGSAFFHKAKAQNAADAAALAGAHEMAAGKRTHQIIDAIVTYATGNGSESGGYVINWRNKSVTVSANEYAKAIFAKITGVDGIEADANAEARVFPVYEAEKMLPLGVHLSSFRIGRKYRLFRDRSGLPPPWWKEDNPHGKGSKRHGHAPPVPPGWESGNRYVWLDWNGRSPGNWRLIRDIRHPERSGTRHVGERMWERLGVVENRWLWGALLEWRRHAVAVPVYDMISFSRGRRQVRVIGFASFVITNAGGVTKWGNPWWCGPLSIFCSPYESYSYIEGHFARKIIPSKGWNGPEYGMYTVNLTQ